MINVTANRNKYELFGGNGFGTCNIVVWIGGTFTYGLACISCTTMSFCFNTWSFVYATQYWKFISTPGWYLEIIVMCVFIVHLHHSPIFAFKRMFGLVVLLGLAINWPLELLKPRSINPWNTLVVVNGPVHLAYWE